MADRAEEHLLRSVGIRPPSEIAFDVPLTPKVPFGLSDIDLAIGGGLCPGLLNVVVGFAQNGKTAMCFQPLAYNPLLKAVILSDDERSAQIMRKLIAFRTGRTTQEVDRMGAERRLDAWEKTFPYVHIVGDNEVMKMSPEDMAVALPVIEEAWGQPADLVVVDYLSKLRIETDHDSNEVRQQAQWFKDWSKDHSETVLLVGHQANRKATGHYGSLTFEHVLMGSEQEVDGVMLGVRRDLYSTKMTDDQQAWERDHPSINISVMKNKVSGGLTVAAGIKYNIDRSGRIAGGFRDKEGVAHGLNAEGEPDVSDHREE